MSDIYTFVFIPIFLSAIAYWGMSGCWFILDLYLAPHFRISGGEIIDWNLYKKTAKHVLLLQSTTPLVMYSLIPIWKLRGVDTSFEGFFTFFTFLKLLYCPFISDFIFYSTHKICHLKIFYNNVHKIHHEWIVPCALAAAYTSFYEFLICNLPTFLLPPLILNLNWYGAQVWFIFATLNVVIDHSGYVFLEKSIHHAKHHKYKMYNYGSKMLDEMLFTNYVN